MKPTSPLAARLPRRDADQARFIRAMQRDGCDLVPWARAGTAVHALAPQPQACAAPLQPVVLSAAGNRLPAAELFLSADDLLALSLPTALTQGLPRQHLAALLAPALDAWRERLGATLAGTLALTTPAPVTRWPSPGMLPLQAQPVSLLGRLRMAVSPQVAQAAWSRTPPPPTRDTWADVPLMLHLCLQPPAQPLDTLEPGDWWWPGWRRGAALEALLRVAAPRGTPVAWTHVMVDSGGLAAWSMQAMDDDARKRLNDLAGLADAAAPIELQLPAASMSLRELAGLRPGALLPLGGTLEDLPLTLCSGGQPIALGRLVSVGEQLGVEVTELLHRSAPELGTDG